MTDDIDREAKEEAQRLVPLGENPRIRANVAARIAELKKALAEAAAVIHEDCHPVEPQTARSEANDPDNLNVACHCGFIPETATAKALHRHGTQWSPRGEQPAPSEASLTAVAAGRAVGLAGLDLQQLAQDHIAALAEIDAQAKRADAAEQRLRAIGLSVGESAYIDELEAERDALKAENERLRNHNNELSEEYSRFLELAALFEDRDITVETIREEIVSLRALVAEIDRLRDTQCVPDHKMLIEACFNYQVREDKLRALVAKMHDAAMDAPCSFDKPEGRFCTIDNPICALHLAHDAARAALAKTETEK